MDKTERKGNVDKKSIKSMDDLFEYIGNFGTYQKRFYFLVILPAGICAMPTLSTVFMLADRLKRCKIPSLPNDTYASQGSWHDALINRNIPLSSDSNKTYDDCNMLMYSNTTGNMTSSTSSCSSWVYDDSVFQNTMPSEFDIVCDKVVYQSTASMVYMSGMFLGTLLFGSIGDIFGRKPALCLAITTQFSANVGIIFAPNYITFVVLRFFAGVGNVGVFAQAFIAGIEYVGKPKRVLAGSVIEVYWCAGELVLAGIAYFLPNWRHIQIAITCLIATTLSFWIIMPESIRWLFSTGRDKQANEQLQRVAKVNKVSLPDNIKVEIEESSSSILKPLKQLLKHPTMILRTGILSFSWFVCNIGYYGLTLNSGRIGGNIYVNYTVSVLMEVAAYLSCWFLVGRIGRRASFCSTMLLGGVSCLCSIFTVEYASDDLSWTTIMLSSIGKFGVSAAFAIIYIFTPECYPTSLRSSTCAVCHFVGKIGAVVSPYIADLALLVDSDMKVALPLIVFGAAMIASGILAFALPETLGKNLPETIQEAAYMKKKNKDRGESYELPEKYTPIKEKF
ncbi:hypothetical protein FSP39_016360 [Pinctada imbricata]|uniref:Major facilitator superfamily (MFS) profile domain-containing protein n=1 Tax=Pinctada imbricata TaxID=66713 RepID=A0AA88Y9X9_PINIB|nr:hypothetical protein FSP39_016360 [Pinctada imbricata]